MSEVAGEDGVNEGSENNLSTIGLRKSHPEDQDKLEGEVEWKPVDGTDGAFENTEESIDDPVRQPLSIIGSIRGEQSIQRVVGRNGESNSIDKELGCNVEEDEEEVQSTETEDNIDLWNGGLLLKVIENLVLSEL